MLLDKVKSFVIGDERKRKFEFAGVSAGTFLFLRFGLGAIGLTFFSVFVNPVAGAFMAALAWGISAMYLHSTYHKARELLAVSIPDLADYLSVVLEAGLSVPLAIDEVLPFLGGPMRTAWRRVINRIRARVPVREALEELAVWSESADMVSMVRLLQNYLEFGVPPMPFQELADHIAELRVMQKKYKLGVLTTGTSFFAAVGLLAAVGAVVLPFVVDAFTRVGMF
jgi:pilus assembly protein TadC